MSEKFIVVNHSRRELFRPIVLGEHGKLAGVIDGEMTTLAVSLLGVASTKTHWNDRPQLKGNPLLGAWHEGKLELIGQYDDRYESVTSEYQEISLGVISLLCAASDRAIDYFVRRFGECQVTTVELGRVIFETGCETLRSAIEASYGENWTRVLKRAAVKLSMP